MVLCRAQPCEVYVQSGQLAGRGLFGVCLKKTWATTKKRKKQIRNLCFGVEGVLSENLVKWTPALLSRE